MRAPDVAAWRRRRVAPHPLSWLVGRFAGELGLAAALLAAGAVVATQPAWWAVVVSVVPIAESFRALWRGWWLGAAVVAELRWRAVLAKLVRGSRVNRRPR